jgi:threonine 3-dehydrogenase
MQALVKQKAERGIWLQQVPVPTIGPHDVLVHIHKTAICGTDIHIYQWDHWAQKTIPVPLITGHEFSGRVVAMGSAVDRIKIGQRVSGEGHITCGQCRSCQQGIRHLCPNTIGVGVQRAGCFAEYLAIPQDNIFMLPDYISDTQGAILDPLGNAVHTTLSFDLVGQDILITGAGPIGIMACAIAKKAGARSVVIIDINPYRLQLAQRMGADQIINLSDPNSVDLPAVQSLLDIPEGFSVGLEMSGHASALPTLLHHLSCGGKVALLGIPPEQMTIDWNTLVFKGITLKGIYGREIFKTWHQMASLLYSGLNIGPVITHEIPVSEYQAGFEAMASGQTGKVILNWL